MVVRVTLGLRSVTFSSPVSLFVVTRGSCGVSSVTSRSGAPASTTSPTLACTAVTLPTWVTFSWPAGSATTEPVRVTVLVMGPLTTSTCGRVTTADGNSASPAAWGADLNAITTRVTAITAQITRRRVGKMIRRVTPTAGLQVKSDEPTAQGPGMLWED
ncbi:hypothetical protein D3C74_362960 [compost metagenome]